MKTFPLFASLLLCSSAFAAKLEGSLAVRQEILEGIRWEEKQCERSALVSGELLRLNHEDEDLIHARIAERMSACEARAARRSQCGSSWWRRTRCAPACSTQAGSIRATVRA